MLRTDVPSPGMRRRDRTRACRGNREHSRPSCGHLSGRNRDPRRLDVDRRPRAVRLLAANGSRAAADHVSRADEHRPPRVCDHYGGHAAQRRLGASHPPSRITIGAEMIVRGSHGSHTRTGSQTVNTTAGRGLRSSPAFEIASAASFDPSKHSSALAGLGSADRSDTGQIVSDRDCLGSADSPPNRWCATDSESWPRLQRSLDERRLGIDDLAARRASW